MLQGPTTLSPPFLRVLLRPENLSHRGILTKGYSRLCGRRTPRERKELSVPREGEIDAIAIVIERDIISIIIIIIISTIYTAITTAAPPFMDTDKFRNMSATYGLDSQVVANLYRAFASHYELPKKNFDKYHEPYKDKIDSSVNKCVVVETVDNVIPEAYIEKTPFPAKMKEYSVISSAVNKSEKKPKEPEEQIKIEPAVAIVKDLVTENVEDGHIIFCEDASNIVSHPNKSKQVSVPMLSVRIGDHCYYGLCDIGASVSAIPYELYTEIMHEIGSCELEDIDVVIHLANRETISPIGIVRDVEVLCGKIKYPADFLVLGSAASDHCPIIFGRPFLNTCGAIIDCKKEKILTRFAGEPYEFNFSKFTKTPYKTDLPSNDFKMEQCASIVLVPNNPLQQHLENSESEAFRKERDELEEIFLRQPILKHDLPVEDLGTTPPPKEDPVFDLKPLPDNLKYAHIDDKKIYPVIISSKLSEIEEERWVSPVHCVPKKGGMTVVPNDNDELIPQRIVVGYRMCIDFRKVNKVTKKDHYPLPFIDQMLERLSKNTHFCFLDGYSGFSQIAVKAKDQEKTTFTCPYGTYAYRQVFMDDFSVYGNSFDNCLRNLDKVLQRCEETNLVLNWEKCHFMVNEGIVLGHKISREVLKLIELKLKQLRRCPIRGMLKKALTTAPVVEPPDWNLPFEIMCDASDFAVGAVLGQRFRPYIVDSKVTIHTDHAAIRYLMTKKDAKPRLIRWVLLQEFDLHIIDRKGADNPVADNLSRLENIAYDPVPVNDSFPNEQLAVIKDITLEIEPRKRSDMLLDGADMQFALANFAALISFLDKKIYQQMKYISVGSASFSAPICQEFLDEDDGIQLGCQLKAGYLLAVLRQVRADSLVVDVAGRTDLNKIICPSKSVWAEALEDLVMSDSGELLWPDERNVRGSFLIEDGLPGVGAGMQVLGFINNEELMLASQFSDMVTSVTSEASAPSTLVGASSALSQESEALVASNQSVRRRGRPRKQETPTVESQVKRSTRSNKQGYLEQALPYQPSKRKTSKVPKATPPEVLQIEEMQRIGVEDCHIDPDELSVDRLMKVRADQ
ncbi:hypothetical protein QYE76_066237 [Lolium multiflorum]|uniref:Uncharacterized protein n=1 Tax=Lolium multiflorum TaxID=4521 RepID=A0AAD8SCA4_LOLMU|nr:hypothetical protein QYE76_066237 [Lolium multiflorum]